MRDPPRVAVVSSATGKEFLEYTLEWLDLVDRTVYPDFSINLVDDGGELVTGLVPFLSGRGGRAPRIDVARVEKKTSISATFNSAIGLGLQKDPDFVCLLTTSTRPTKTSWLQQLVDRMVAHPSAGIAGTFNVNRDGTVNHAGMAVMHYADLITGHIGRDVNRGEGLEGLERMVEAVTGACMLLRREILDFGVLFDETLLQACNDPDLCFQAREHGYGTLYVPTVTMVRDEGHTRDSPKYKVPYEPDYRRFNEKWKNRSAAWL